MYHGLLRRIASSYDVLRLTTTYYDVLRRDTTYYDVLRRITKYYDAPVCLQQMLSDAVGVALRDAAITIARRTTTYYNVLRRFGFFYMVLGIRALGPSSQVSALDPNHLNLPRCPPGPSNVSSAG